LTSSDFLVLKKESNKSSLLLWSLIKQTLGKGKNGYILLHYLSKIFNIAHVLPTTSVGVEQIFSLFELIRTNLREDNAQSLALIHQKLQDPKKFSVSHEILKAFDQAKMKIIE